MGKAFSDSFTIWPKPLRRIRMENELISGDIYGSAVNGIITLAEDDKEILFTNQEALAAANFLLKSVDSHFTIAFVP
jgi:hypothetical protein